VNQADALDLVRAAIWAVLMATAPAIGAAMLVGLLIGLLQAVTQVQEVTLTFVPKIVAILIVGVLTAPLIGSVLLSFTELAYSRIERGF
jgi:flagellar biosynthetic protein FliQ